MSKASDYFKYYQTDLATAVAADITVGKIAYIPGGRVIGGGVAPVGSLDSFYRTRDANITPYDVSAWKTAFGKEGIILGLYYPGPIPAHGGIMGITASTDIYDAVGDTFTI